MRKIEGKRVLITGASSGIGAACASAFARERCRVILVARRAERMSALARELVEAQDATVRTAVVDVRDGVAVAAFVAGLESPWDEIDILVNNAGLARGIAPAQEGRLDDWDEMIDTNVKGLLYVTRAVVPGMVARGSGHIVNIGSIAGHEAYPGGNVYCATKHAVAALTRGFAMDLLGSGVRVSSVDPGMVRTEFSDVRFHGDRDRAAAVYRGFEPLAAEDVAEAVVFCATRPAHANVLELILMPAAQASSVHVSRIEGV
jgi:3-hydroxy acid dehydrogenase / malonic semialdehyde reductase